MTWQLGELEADVSALADGEHEVLLAALLRDAEEESAALGARFTARASEGDKRSREVGEEEKGEEVSLTSRPLMPDGPSQFFYPA